MEQKIKYGVIHCHTENSLKDSTLTPDRLCERAAELGAPAVVLSDHGVLTGVYEFMSAAKKYGIKGIPGVEAYLQEDKEDTRKHLLLIPKDYEGYKAICKAVTESNTRIMGSKNYEVPCMNMKILKKYFGKESNGHQHIIATSACVGGPLSQILLSSNRIQKKLSDLEKHQKKCSNPNDPTFLSNQATLNVLGHDIKEMIIERDSLVKPANRKFVQKDKALASVRVNHPDEYEEAKTVLDAEKRETEIAAKRLSELKSLIAKTKKKETILRKKCSEASKTHPKWKSIQEKIDAEKALLRTDKELYEQCKNAAAEYSELFGNGCFYIELQYHGIEDEKYTMPRLASIARELKLPIVACNDVHYSDNTSDCIRARQIINSLRFNKWEPLRPGDTEYYIKTDDELTAMLTAILGADIVNEAMRGIGDIIAQCDVVFPKETHYPKYISEDGKSASEMLRKLAYDGISRCYPNGAWTEIHQKRLEHELEVIDRMGFSDYLCIVEDFLNYGRKLGIENPEEVGMGVGPGRGSAVGSIVCYLTGITNLDPITYELLFERFLNPERVSMPDIDSDFDINIRGKVIEYVKQKYGENAVCNIITKGTTAARASVRNVARVLGDAKFGDSKALLSLGDRIAKSIPKGPNVVFNDELMNSLSSAFSGNANALEILHDVKLIEGTAVNYGMHAAGVIIADNGDVKEYVPFAWNSDNAAWVCQCSMTEAESDAGLLKMDFLGLKNLNIISEAERMIKRNHGIKIDVEAIGRELLKNGRTTSYDKKKNVFDHIFSEGKTNSVFQFESSGMKSMLKRFRPSNIHDLILLVAAYRPGPMQYLNEIIETKHGRSKPKYIVPELESILAPTYGKPVYQEQIMQIFNRVAGFSLGEADIIRRAMSKKKLSVLTDPKTNYQGRFIDGLLASGAKRKDAEDFWEELLDFANYAFNKSHACAYAHMAFYTAWLKLNYPAEYMTAVLNYAEQKKIPALISECRDLGIKVLPPDINRSEADFTCRDGEILFGISSIKTVKGAADDIIEQRKEAQYHSVKDFIMRGHTKQNVTEALISSGAMDCWCNNREAIRFALPDMLDDRKKIIDKRAAYDKQLAMIKQSLRKRIELIARLSEIQELFDADEKDYETNWFFLLLQEDVFKGTEFITKALSIAEKETDEKKLYQRIKRLVKKEISYKEKAEQLLNALDEADRYCSSAIVRVLKGSLVVNQADASKLERIETQLQEYEQRFNHIILPINLPENKIDRLEKEKELLGMYVSGHPLDSYDDVKALRNCKISDVEEAEYLTVCGQIKEFRKVQRKKDGLPMAFFLLEDESGEIEVCCFVKAYADYQSYIGDGYVVAISGKCVVDSDDEEEETKYQLYASSIKRLQPTKEAVIISVDSMIDWAEIIYPQVLAYSGNDYKVLVHDKFLGEIRETVDLEVSSLLLEADIDGAEISVFKNAG